MSESGGGTNGQACMPRLGRMSRTTVRSAIELLQERHGIANSDAAFAVLRAVSQKHNVKLRAIAAAVLATDGPGGTHCETTASIPPALDFSERAGLRNPNRTDVLHDLMRAAVALAGSDYSTVQVRDPIHGGLVLEGHRGFGRDFTDFFSYVDTEGTACGESLAQARTVVVDDVEYSSTFRESELAVMMAARVGSVASTPLLDSQGNVRGVVSTHYVRPHRVQDDAAIRKIEQLAGDCARWLSWYDGTVMPEMAAAVHAAAKSAVAARS